MPYPNEHASRQLPPEMFEKFRRGKPEGFPDGISVIYGILPKSKGGGSRIQAIRFDRKKWSPAQARVWLRERKFKVHLVEAVGRDKVKFKVSVGVPRLRLSNKSNKSKRKLAQPPPEILGELPYRATLSDVSTDRYFVKLHEVISIITVSRVKTKGYYV